MSAFIVNSRLSVRDQTAASVPATPVISQNAPTTPTAVPSPRAAPASPTSVLATPVPSPTLAPTATPTGSWISLSPASGPPGTIVEVHGYVPHAPTPHIVNGQAEPSHGNGCWDGCPNGLREDALPLIWSTTQPGHFTMPFVVPSAPWVTADGAHSLTPGDYTIGVTCLIPPTVAKKGPGFVPCDQRPTAATTTFHLTGPGSPRCQTAPCAQLTLSPDHGPPGTEVQVSGWAPLNDIIGNQPFVYNLVIENSGSNASVPFQLASVQQDLDGSIHGTARQPWLHSRSSATISGGSKAQPHPAPASPRSGARPSRHCTAADRRTPIAVTTASAINSFGKLHENLARDRTPQSRCAGRLPMRPAVD